MIKPQTKTEHWLNAKRIYVYPRMVLTVFIIATIVRVALSKNMVDMKGTPIGSDFVTYWAASHLALQGHAADAYNIGLLSKAEEIAVPVSKEVFAWYYPPSFYLLILPVALLPYLAAYLVFITTTLVAYVSVFRRVTRDVSALWCLAAFSGLWMNFLHGQNAFLTAALAAVALLCIERRPHLAGLFIGLLVMKPHLALLFPVALIAIRAWRTLFVAIVTALCFLGIGAMVLGPATLKACMGSLQYARSFLESGALPWGKMPTFFAFSRVLGVPVRGAYAVHLIGAIFAIYCVWIVWRRCSDQGLRAATLMTATFLVSPYVFDYDLAWLAFPIAWMAIAGKRDGWHFGEREVLVAAWILPLCMSFMKAVMISVQVGPFVICALLLSILLRTMAKSSSDRGTISGGNVRRYA